MCNSRHVVPSLRFAATPPIAFDPEPSIPAIKPDTGDDLIPLILSLCEKCNLVQSLDVVNPDLLFSHSPCRPSTGEAVRFQEQLAAQVIASGKLGQGDLVVDIGSGNNSLLEIFRKHGMKVVGIDPGDGSRAIAEQQGLPHYQEYFSPATASRIVKEHGNAAAVVSTFTFGSIDNLHAVCAGVRYLLKPGGILHVVEPYLPDFLSKVAIGLVHHERITFASLVPLDAFFRSVQLHLFDARRVDLGPGCVHIGVQRSDGEHVVTPGVAAMIEEEKRLGIHSMAKLNTFAAAAEDKKNSVRASVESARRQGRTVAGYGLTPSAMTLIHEFGWNKDVLAGVIDNTARTFVETVPGTDLPVLSSDQARQAGVNALVVFGDPALNGISEDLPASVRASGGTVITLE